jgi:hypothetical protein
VRGLAGQHAHLRSLLIESCRLGDEGVRLILEAFRPVQFLRLVELDLWSNGITPVGLQHLTDGLALLAVPLKTLNLSNNEHLFDDEQSTQRFLDRVLLSENMAIDELHVRHCGGIYLYLIIKSCEHIKSKMRVLDIGEALEGLPLPHSQDQLVESLPKMKRLQALHCHGLLNQVVLMTTCDGKVFTPKVVTWRCIKILAFLKI